MNHKDYLDRFTEEELTTLGTDIASNLRIGYVGEPLTFLDEWMATFNGNALLDTPFDQLIRYAADVDAVGQAVIAWRLELGK